MYFYVLLTIVGIFSFGGLALNLWYISVIESANKKIKNDSAHNDNHSD